MFYIPFIVVLLYGIGGRKSSQRNKYFCIITGIMYFLIAALRSSSVGTDTHVYVDNFLRLGNYPLSYIARVYDKDIFFFYFIAILGRLTENYTILFIIVSGWYGYSVWRFIHKYSPDAALSIIVLLALNLYQFTLTGMRQAIAIGFVVWAFDLVLQKKYLKAAVWILIGSMFHMSALVALTLIPIKMISKKVTRRRALIICGLLALVFVFRTYVAGLLIVLIDERDYVITEENTGMTMTFVIFALLVMTAIFMNEFTARKENAAFFFLTGAVACAFQMLVATQPIFFRLAFYFLMMYPFMIPMFISSLHYKYNYAIMKYLLYGLMSVQYLLFTMNSSGIAPYRFFWQT